MINNGKGVNPHYKILKFLERINNADKRTRIYSKQEQDEYDEYSLDLEMNRKYKKDIME